MRKKSKSSIWDFVEKKENRDNFLIAFFSGLAIVTVGFIGTIVSGLFSYMYWLSYFKRLEIPMEFYRDALIPITDLVVTIFLAMVFGFIVSLPIIIAMDEIHKRIRHSKILLILSEVLFVILTVFTLFYAATLTFNVWPGFLLMAYVIIFFTGFIWHSCCVGRPVAYYFTRYAKRIGYILLSVATFFLILYTVFIYGGYKNRLATTDWYTEIRYCAEERKLKPDQKIKIILFETDDYYYTVEAEYHVLDSNHEGQIVVKNLDHTLINKGTVNTYSDSIRYIYIYGSKKWMPPSDKTILFLIIFIYCYIQLAALFIGLPTRKITNKPSDKPRK